MSKEPFFCQQQLLNVNVEHDHIPAKLKSARRWAGWEWEYDELVKRRSRRPIDAKGKPTDPIAPANWLSFDEASALLDDYTFDGIWFVWGTAKEVRHFAEMNPRKSPQEFDAEAAARAPWYHAVLPDDPTGGERLSAIAQHAFSSV